MAFTRSPLRAFRAVLSSYLSLNRVPDWTHAFDDVYGLRFAFTLGVAKHDLPCRSIRGGIPRGVARTAIGKSCLDVVEDTAQECTIKSLPCLGRLPWLRRRRRRIGVRCLAVIIVGPSPYPFELPFIGIAGPIPGCLVREEGGLHVPEGPASAFQGGAEAERALGPRPPGQSGGVS